MDTERANGLRRGERKRRGPKPKPITVTMSRYRRKEANARERQRQGEINKGFEGLRERIPHPVLSKGKCEKLRKIDILHVAISYIRALENVLESGEPGINEFANSLYSVVSQDECQGSTSPNHLKTELPEDTPSLPMTASTPIPPPCDMGETLKEGVKLTAAAVTGDIKTERAEGGEKMKKNKVKGKNGNMAPARFHANLLRYKPVFLGERPQSNNSTTNNKTSCESKPVHTPTPTTNNKDVDYKTSCAKTKINPPQPQHKVSNSSPQEYYSQPPQRSLSDHMYSSTKCPTSATAAASINETSESTTATAAATVAAPTNTGYDEYFSDISFSSAESEIFSDVSLLDPVPSFLDSMLATPTPPPSTRCSDHSPEYDSYSSPSEASFELISSTGVGGNSKHFHATVVGGGNYSPYSTTPPSRIASPPLTTSRGPLLTSTSIIFKESAAPNKLSGGFSANASPFGGGHLAMTSPDAMEGIENTCFGGFFDSFHHNTSMPMFSK